MCPVRNARAPAATSRDRPLIVNQPAPVRNVSLAGAAPSGRPAGSILRAAACYADRMDALTPWLTPALLVALFTWLRFDLREQRREMNGRIDALNKRFDKRFDEIGRELAELRERMARLEGALEGFLAGRRDRDAA